ncbi:bile acid:sodium symporter family protein [Sulfurospirillum barnesii]|uniref:Putative Na+-dependent transporter n=1 Tax=Sulfurospirillum barnesii (strain ATCC 700032 / DSM 10660 / SES-3) TaxID=760154 RepID=I3XWC3_SULBS|nr:bile acid:sodium symporter family protein [Sulfurospirillum barnesii]AFL68247.1 putative Na+-dependent transporter [Sulfurospirillum barnesii SES-3]
MMIARINTLFPLWALLFSILAYSVPEHIVPYKAYITPLLVAIMFFMGVTLRLEDFARVLKKPKPIILTILLQFTIMPLAALLLSKALGFSTELLIGMVLVGAVSGGTASNVITYLAKGDVALSITMTITSTLLSIVATPFLSLLYVGQTVPVPASDMLISILQLVLAPVFVGVIVNYFLHRFIKRYEPYLATLSMLAIVLIIAIVVALNQGRIASIGLMVIVGIMLHNLTGLFSGYWIARFMGFEHKICKTIAIEVGMQNSGLAVALAMKYFTPLSALPGAIFSVWHNISGALLAGYWSRQK